MRPVISMSSSEPWSCRRHRDIAVAILWAVLAGAGHAVEGVPAGCLPLGAADQSDRAIRLLRQGDGRAREALSSLGLAWPDLPSASAALQGSHRAGLVLPGQRTVPTAWIGVPPAPEPAEGWPVLIADGIDTGTGERLRQRGILVIVCNRKQGPRDVDHEVAETLTWVAWGIRASHGDARRAAYLAAPGDLVGAAAHQACAPSVWAGVALLGEASGPGIADLDSMDAAVEWAANRERLTWSPAPLLLPASGPSLAAVIATRTGLEDLDDPVVALLHQERWSEALRLLQPRLTATGQAVDFRRAAIAALPALKQIPSPPFAAEELVFKPLAAKKALGHLQSAIDRLNRLSDLERRQQRGLSAVIYLDAARIHAGDFLAKVSQPGNAWVRPYQLSVAALRQALSLDPSIPGAHLLADLLRSHFPHDRIDGGMLPP